MLTKKTLQGIDNNDLEKADVPAIYAIVFIVSITIIDLLGENWNM